MFRKLIRMLKEPDRFFPSLGEEGFREPFLFLISVCAVIAVFTPVAHLLGWPSTDLSASLQAQIVAWRTTQASLLPRLGGWAYLVEVPLILLLAVLFAAAMTVFLHLIYRIVGGKGTLLQAWKAVCYGVGPCLIFGWVPYWSLLVACWSLVIQFYYAPKTLYGVREGRALMILALVVGATLLEFATTGTTVGFAIE
jgi:hypothetical protein